MTPCNHLADFLREQRAVMAKHLDEHAFLRHMKDRTEALASFVHDYGWLLRELYCSRICPDREVCETAKLMLERGDLLRDKKL